LVLDHFLSEHDLIWYLAFLQLIGMACSKTISGLLYEVIYCFTGYKTTIS